MVKSIGRYLQNRNERDYIMYLIGIYSGLRVSDILKLQVMNVYNKSSVTLREQKTGKQKVFPINPYLKRELQSYINKNDMNRHDYLIRSREGGNKPLSRVRAYQILNEAADYFGIENIGTHTMRKTFGYFYYRQTNDVVTLQKIFNHRSINETLLYIGVDQENINKTVNSLKIY